MQIDGAVIKEQGVTFAIVVVKDHILGSQLEAQKAQSSFTSIFPGMPIVLMSRNSHSAPRYFGRNDIVKFLANVSPSRIPWKRYNVN